MRGKMLLLFLFFVGIDNLSVAQSNVPIKSNSFMMRNDGIYNDTILGGCGRLAKGYGTYSHIILINSSQLIYLNGMRSYDNHYLKMSEYFKGKTLLGNYRISNDTIFASNLPISLLARGGRIKSYPANFRGIIKNSDTITDWQMIKPYPKANARLNDYFEFELKPKLLYFIESKELLGLDSLYQHNSKGWKK